MINGERIEKLIEDFFRSSHLKELDDTLIKLEEIYKNDKEKFGVVIFSMVSFIGRENSGFARRMLDTWLIK